LRILVYGINYRPELTGIGKYTGEMCEWLASRGHEVRVVTAPPYYPEWRVHSGHSGRTYRVEHIGGVRVWRCPLWVPARPTGLRRILHHLSFALSTLPVMIAQGFWRPHVVLLLEPPLMCAPAALLAARLCGARSWLHVQDFEVDAAFALGLLPERAKPLVLYLERMLMRSFDRVSTISRRMLDRLELKGVEGLRRVLFRNWVDCREIHPMSGVARFRSEFGISTESFVALYSGNMGEKQGLEVVIETARLMNGNDDVIFVLCGAGSARTRLESAAAGLDNVRWLPLQPAGRLNELLNLADVHLLPQRADAADLVMPSKLCGMLASGQAVVATVLPDTEIAETLSHAGLITKPGDANALAGAIAFLQADAASRQNMGKGARGYAELHFASETVLGRFEEELESVAGPSARAAAPGKRLV